MKRIVIACELNSMLEHHDSFLKRSNVQIFTVRSSDEIIPVHRREIADLIITPVDLPGTDMDQVLSQFRSNVLTKNVLLVLISPYSRAAIEMCSRCKPNAVILRPVLPAVLLARAQQVLGLDWRENYRVVVNVSVDGSSEGSAFLCRSRDVSTTGILLETEKELPKGSRLTCSFYLPDSVRIQAEGEVVRASKEAGTHHCGVKFLKISRDELESLENFIDRLALKRAS